jgi:hypothetical protein
MKQRLHPFALVIVTLLLSGCAAFVDYGSESSFGIAARGNLPLGRVLSPEGSVGGATVSRLELAGSLHRSWPDNGTYTEGNVDLVLPLTTLGGGAARSYLGGGLHVGRVSPEVGDDRTELGVNVLAGVRFDRRVAAPFFEVRGALGGYDQLSAAVGVQLFGGMF